MSSSSSSSSSSSASLSKMTASGLNTSLVSTVVETAWASSIERTLCDYIAIPNVSPMFDHEWETNGLQERAVDLMCDWIKKQQAVIQGLNFRVVREKGKTPLIFATVDGHASTSETILLYGHLDKQPPLYAGWIDGLGPYKPIIRDGKLYGRGGADDGYAVFAALTAIHACQLQKVPLSRCVIMIEACEESGSRDLDHYMGVLAADIGTPSLCICLDSGCGNYDQMWLTTSLRGMLAAKLSVSILKEGIHSGTASGIVPSTFRILRTLLDRIENSQTGELPKSFYVDIPAEDYANARECAATLGDGVVKKFPFVQGARPIHDDFTELLLNSTWRPTMCVTGAEGLPPFEQAGNVLRPTTSVMLSFRLPPTLNPEPLVNFLKHELERDSPYGAAVTFQPLNRQPGWHAPPLEPWLLSSLQHASNTLFGRSIRFTSEGGSIPFMGMLGRRYPGTQFVVTGLLGPASNAHGPNEFMHIQMFKNLTACISCVLADHYKAKVTDAKLVN